MTMRRLRWMCGCVLVMVAALGAQAPAAAPALTAVQKLQVENALKDVQIAQLQLQAAERQVEDTRTAATALLKGLDVKGYRLDLQTLTYVKDTPKQ